MTPRSILTSTQATMIAYLDWLAGMVGLPPYSDLLAQAVPLDPDALPSEVVSLDAFREQPMRDREAVRKVVL